MVNAKRALMRRINVIIAHNIQIKLLSSTIILVIIGAIVARI